MIKEIKRKRLRIKIVNLIDSLGDGKLGINSVGFFYNKKLIYQICFNYHEGRHDIVVFITAIKSLLGEVLSEEEIIKIIKIKHNIE